MLTFQVYRLDMNAENISEFQGEKINEIKLSGKFVSGEDTVSSVKEKLREKLAVSAEDKLTLYFNYSPMKNDKLFYADHFIMMPAWVQVLVHQESSDSAVVNKIEELAKSE